LIFPNNVQGAPRDRREEAIKLWRRILMSLQSRDRTPPYLPPEESSHVDRMPQAARMSPRVRWPIAAGALAVLAMVVYGIEHRTHPHAGPPVADSGDQPSEQAAPTSPIGPVPSGG
jgi:hypothetical protein